MYKILLYLILLPFLTLGQVNRQDAIKDYLLAQVKVNDFSGAVLIVKGGQTVYAEAFGLADREWHIPNTIDTKFRIGSVTKQFTAAAILCLEQEGKLKVSDKISKYIPGFPNGDSITLHFLLCHRSGIGDYSEDKRFDSLSMFQYSPKEIVEYIERLPKSFAPNAGYQYSNSNYFLLGYIIEQVSGLSYHDFIAQRLLLPLKLEASSVEVREQIVEKRAKGYVQTKQGYSNEHYYSIELLYSAGGMYSTVQDLYKWQVALTSEHLISNAAARRMFTPYTYNNMHYGYGAVIDTFLHQQRIWHSGGGFAFNTNISWYPAPDIHVIVCSNNQSNSEGISNALAAITLGTDVQLPYEHKPFKAPLETLEKYTGKWIGVSSDLKIELEIYMKDGKLYRRALNAQDLELIPESGTKFYYSDGSDKQLEFSLNKKGRVESGWFIKDGIKYGLKR